MVVNKSEGAIVPNTALFQIFENNSIKYKNDIALVDEETGYSLNYFELNDSIKDIAKVLQSFGIQKNDKVSLFAENHPRWVVIDQAIMATGATSVVRGSLVPVFELEHIYKHSDSILFIADSLELINHFLPILKEQKTKSIIYIGTEEFPLPSDLEFPVLTYQEAINLSKEMTFKPVEILSEDIATIVYTSGTSGMPKGAMLSHSNMMSQIYDCNKRIGFEERKTFVGVLPLWHVGPRAYDYYFLSIGSKIVYTKYKNYIETLKKYRPDYTNCVPKVINLIYEEFQEEISKKNVFYKFIFELAFFASVRMKKTRRAIENTCINHQNPNVSKVIRAFLNKILLSPLHKLFKIIFYNDLRRKILKDNIIMMSGAATLARNVEDFFDVFEVPILIGYGLTESSPLLTHSSIEYKKYYSVGRPFDDTEIKIVNIDTHKDLGKNKKGLVIARGPQIMQGYYKNPEETAKVILEDGFLVTGDRGWLTEDNYLVITGRYKDVIVLSNGESIEPISLEQACLENPIVNQIIFSGQDKPYLTALVVLNQSEVESWAKKRNISENKMLENKLFKQDLINDLNKKLADRDNYRHFEKLKNISFLIEPFTAENGLMTFTSKLKRVKIYEKYNDLIERMYK